MSSRNYNSACKVSYREGGKEGGREREQGRESKEGREKERKKKNGYGLFIAMILVSQSAQGHNAPKILYSKLSLPSYGSHFPAKNFR